MPVYTEPTWTNPYPTFDDSILVKEPTDFIVLDAYFLRLAQWLFSSSYRIRNPRLKGYIWTEAFETTKLIIDQAGNTHFNRGERRPSIFLNPISLTETPAGLPDKILGVSAVGLPGFTTNSKGQFEVLSNLYSYTTECVTLGEARALAVELASFLGNFSPAITDDCNLEGFGVKGIVLKEPINREGVIWYRYDVSFIAEIILRIENGEDVVY